MEQYAKALRRARATQYNEMETMYEPERLVAGESGPMAEQFK